MNIYYTFCTIKCYGFALRTHTTAVPLFSSSVIGVPAPLPCSSQTLGLGLGLGGRPESGLSSGRSALKFISSGSSSHTFRKFSLPTIAFKVAQHLRVSSTSSSNNAVKSNYAQKCVSLLFFLWATQSNSDPGGWYKVNQLCDAVNDRR